MTIWNPSLGRDPATKYFAIAEAIARDVEAGVLAPGDRLPTQRRLAESLGVTVGTVSRGYAEAQRRGLVTGEVGRGTFVRGPRTDQNPFAMPDTVEPDLIDLSMNIPVLGARDDRLAPALGALAGTADLGALLEYQPHAGSARHREVGALWLRRFGVDAFAEQTVLTTGGQHAMLLALSVVARPGDVVLAEALTYPGLQALARLLHLRLEGVDMDGDGLRPDALLAACRRYAPRALYCTPTAQNPTASVMSETRRREIASILRGQGLPLVEDDTYGFLEPDAPPPIATLLPESGFYLTTLSKSVAPGARIGYLHAPAAAVPALSTAVMASTWMVSPLNAELASTWIESGVAAETADWRREEAARRRRLAGEILGARGIALGPGGGLHLWIPLPPPWRGVEFVAQARMRRVAVSSAETFAVGRAPVPHAIRVCLGATRRTPRLEQGLRILAELLAGPPPPAPTCV